MYYNVVTWLSQCNNKVVNKIVTTLYELVFSVWVVSPMPCPCVSPSFQYVSYIEVGGMDFTTPGIKRKLAAWKRNSTLDDNVATSKESYKYF